MLCCAPLQYNYAELCISTPTSPAAKIAKRLRFRSTSYVLVVHTLVADTGCSSLIFLACRTWHTYRAYNTIPAARPSALAFETGPPTQQVRFGWSRYGPCEWNGAVRSFLLPIKCLLSDAQRVPACVRACVRAVGSVPGSVVCVYCWRCWHVVAYS